MTRRTLWPKAAGNKRRASATETYGRDASITLDDYAKNAFVPGGFYYWPERFASGKPGTERIYSNDAFDLAGSALQSIVHEPLYKYIDEEILAPLGMKNTSYWLAGRRSAPYAVAYASVRQKDGRYDYVPAKIYAAMYILRPRIGADSLIQLTENQAGTIRR